MDADGELSGLLKKWKPVEPRADFEARVMSRLHATRRSGDVWGTALERLRNWFRSSVIPLESAAALAGMTAGLILAVQTLPSVTSTSDTRFRILHSASLAGSYVQMVTGGGR